MVHRSLRLGTALLLVALALLGVYAPVPAMERTI